MFNKLYNIIQYNTLHKTNLFTLKITLQINLFKFSYKTRLYKIP